MRYLTSTNPALEQMARLTRRGMAHFATTGPIDATCGQCTHLISVKRKGHRCAEYLRMMGWWGDAIPRATPACRYFEAE